MSSGQTKKKIAELHTLTNQIRLELQQIKRQQPQLQPPRSSVSAKKHFPRHHTPTNIFMPRQESMSRSAVAKKHLQPSSAHQDFSPQVERKHFGAHYRDSVDIEFKQASRRNSFRWAQGGASPSRTNRLLLGEGEKTKGGQGSRSCIRLYPSRYTFKKGLV